MAAVTDTTKEAAYGLGLEEGIRIGESATVAHEDFVEVLGEEDADGLELPDDLNRVEPGDAFDVLISAAYRHGRAEQQLPQWEESIGSILRSDNFNELLERYEQGVLEGIEIAITERRGKP
ncbi:MAG: hypothetical protein UY96_C0013G0004 [Parcubacteria group bacterium GW2011_GWB1_56_8]|nr:MAG: hypothetical protein UY96_C0013G0004 [Parcubacteria group bacterium GW2011_GWB1_56_8]